jgi:hypothetical protein
MYNRRLPGYQYINMNDAVGIIRAAISTDIADPTGLYQGKVKDAWEAIWDKAIADRLQEEGEENTLSLKIKAVYKCKSFQPIKTQSTTQS